MRPLEILLSLANLLTFLMVAVPRLHITEGLRYVVIATLFLAVLQMLIEGPRWQMVPAYVLTGLLALTWLLQDVALVDGNVKQILTNRLVAHFALILCILGIAISAALPILLPVFHFPLPGGPYEIGTVTYHWTDFSRHEVLSPDPRTPRELIVQAWYPARKGNTSSPHSFYLQDADAVAAALTRLHRFPDFLLSHLKYVTTNAVESVPVADSQPSYPVLIFLEGLTGYRQMNTFQIEELVSHGYIVVGIDQPGAAATVVFPDGHQIAITELFTQIKPLVDQSLSPATEAPQLNGQTFKDGIVAYFAQDVSFTLDQLAALNTRDPKGILTGKLDLEHSGVFGMSLGGMVGAEACRSESRLKACLMIDVAMPADVVHSGLRQPAMWMTRPANSMRLERQKVGGWAEKDVIQTQTTMREVYNRLPADGYFVQIPGTFHIDFTDINLLSPMFPITGFSGPIGSQRAHEIINVYSLAFFNRHLKAEPVPLLDGPTANYPEVIFEKRQS
jgi:predicted dienelactone hydrolase